jgi:hypothetical protein
LENTGLRLLPNARVTIPNLQRNQNYIFCCAAYDINEEKINGLGDSTAFISTVQPLPLILLYGYVAKSAFLLKKFNISKQAAQSIIQKFLKSTNIQNQIFNYQKNPILEKVLEYDKLETLSLVEQQTLAEGLFIVGNCDFISLSKNEKFNKIESILEKQFSLLSIVSKFFLSAELACICGDFELVKYSLITAYNISGALYSRCSYPAFLLPLFARLHILMQQIPPDFWTNALRNLASKVSYSFIKTCLFNDERRLAKRLIFDDISLPKISWKVIPMEDKNKNIEFIFPEKFNNQKNFEQFLYSLDEDFSYFVENYNDKKEEDMKKIGCTQSKS